MYFVPNELFDLGKGWAVFSEVFVGVSVEDGLVGVAASKGAGV